jgi:hypothetical protein
MQLSSDHPKLPSSMRTSFFRVMLVRPYESTEKIFLLLEFAEFPRIKLEYRTRRVRGGNGTMLPTDRLNIQPDLDEW